MRKKRKNSLPSEKIKFDVLTDDILVLDIQITLRSLLFGGLASIENTMAWRRLKILCVEKK